MEKTANKKTTKKEVVKNQVENPTKTSKVKTKVIKESKVKEKPEKETKIAKEVEIPKAKEQKVIKEVEAQQKASLIEEVTAHREVKYLYPKDITDTLSRKKWRQQVRNKLLQLERVYFRISDQNSKEYQEAKAAYDNYRSQVLKPTAEV